MDMQGNAVEDEDFRPDYYCKHGTFVGNPYGGDYLCGWCEDGTSDEDFHAYCREQARDHELKMVSDSFFSGLSVVPSGSTPEGYASVIAGVIIAMWKLGR
jgi:hypothetical protein